MAPPRSSAPRLTPSFKTSRWRSCDFAMDRRPRFFKIFFPCQSSKRLVIPQGFWKHIEHETPVAITLTCPSGNVWNVDMVRDRDGRVVFQNGWEDFVINRSLRTGDVLVFRYDGDLLFTVLVFDPTACEKKEAFHVMTCHEEEAAILGESHPVMCANVGLIDDLIINDPKEDIAFPSKNMVKGRISLGPYQALPEEHSSSVDILSAKRPHGDDGSLISNDANWIAGVMMKDITEIEAKEPAIQNKSLHSCGENVLGKTQRHGKLLAVKRSAYKNTSATKLHCLTISRTSTSLNTCNAGTKLRPGSIESCRRTVTEHEKAMALEAARFFWSKHPFCLCVMRDSYVYHGFYMHLPSSFTKLLPMSSVEMNLWDPCNRSWKVKYVYSRRRGAFSGGWGDFSRAHNLESDDVCVFELFKPRELRVHIFRVLEEIASFNCRDRRRKR